jgi:CBS-domain-containing membrane protein
MQLKKVLLLSLCLLFTQLTDAKNMHPKKIYNTLKKQTKKKAKTSSKKKINRKKYTKKELNKIINQLTETVNKQRMQISALQEENQKKDNSPKRWHSHQNQEYIITDAESL